MMNGMCGNNAATHFGVVDNLLLIPRVQEPWAFDKSPSGTESIIVPTKIGSYPEK